MFTEYYSTAMPEFLDSQGQVEGDIYTSGEDLEEDHEVSSLIDDSFEDDYNPTIYLRFNSATRNADEAIEDALNNQQPQTEKVRN